MPAVLHAPLINTVGFMLKERTAEPPVSAFTAVNGRTSPLSSRKLNDINGMPADTTHVRQSTRQSPDSVLERKIPPPTGYDWPSTRTVSESSHHSSSPNTSDEDQPITSPGKRKRSVSPEADRSRHSPDVSAAVRRRLDSQASVGRDDSPHTIAQVQQLAMDHSQTRTLPPIDRAEPERRWSLSRDAQRNGYHHTQHRESRVAIDPSHQDADLHPTHHAQSSGLDLANGLDRSSTTEITRAGVQVDPKKRKRQFANRTKTGCGTCRRRKKKCDESKPECNNCQRGGFICEGYANKIPWPKNGVQKPHPPLQAKDRFPLDSAQLYHSHGTNRDNYPESNAPSSTDGGRTRPIVVEEHDRQPARNGWSAGWSEPPRTSYSSEQHPVPDYSQPPPTSSHARPPSSEQHVPAPHQASLPPRPHNPRIYHHTPQTMSQVVNSSPVVTAEAAPHHSHPHHQPHPPPMAPPTSGPPGPPPPHYAPPPPPRLEKSEKDKMLSREPFQPFSPQLVGERQKCKRAVYHFNYVDNPQKHVAPEERDRLFCSIIKAQWVLPARGSESVAYGHLGREVFVDAPFMCDYGYNLSIADNVDIGTHCKLLDSARISIGRNSSIGANVTIDTQKTPTDPKTTKGSRRTAIAAEVHIGDNVHVGANCTISAGVGIGAGAIIHPGSVVVRDIPANCIARGNPADYVQI